MSRVLDSTDDEVRYPIQTASNFTGAWSFAMWVKIVASDGTWNALIGHHTSAGVGAIGLTRAGSVTANAIASVVTTFTNMYSTELVTASDGWVLVGVSKPAGALAVPRLHVLQSGAWTHQALTGGDGAQGNAPSQAGGTIRVGEFEDTDDAGMKVASDAGWGSELNDAAYEALTADMATWVEHTSPPAYCHQHTQASASDTIPDLMAGGHDSSVINGTTMDGADNPAGFTAYGAGGDSAPVFTDDPTVTGTTTVGETLTCDDGTVTGSPTPDITKQWQRDDEGGGSWSNISSETGDTYDLVEGDLDCMIRCVVTATNTEDDDVANSNEVGPVEAAPPLAFTVYFSGGASNDDPSLSFGGTKSSEEVTTGPGIMGLVGEISAEDAEAGFTRYWCLYLDNEEAAKDVVIEAWVETQPAGGDQAWSIGAAVAASGATETAADDLNTAPAGVTFHSDGTEGSATALGTADAEESKALWLRLAADPGLAADDYSVEIKVRLTEDEG